MQQWRETRRLHSVAHRCAASTRICPDPRQIRANADGQTWSRGSLPLAPRFYWTATAPLQPIASWLHHLSPLRESRLIFHPVRCQLPRGVPAPPTPEPFFHFICQNLCHAATLSCPSHLGNNSTPLCQLLHVFC